MRKDKWGNPVRITVTLDDKLLAKAMQASQLSTEQAVIEAGLRALVRAHAQQQIRSLRGQLHWEGDLDAMRGADDEPAAPL